MRDPFDDARARAWADDVSARLVPRMKASEAVATVFTGRVDVKLAVETGVAVLLDKPLILVVPPGVKIPDKLVRIADRIVEWAPDDTQATADRVAAAMAQLIAEGRCG